MENDGPLKIPNKQSRIPNQSYSEKASPLLVKALLPPPFQLRISKTSGLPSFGEGKETGRFEMDHFSPAGPEFIPFQEKVIQKNNPNSGSPPVDGTIARTEEEIARLIEDTIQAIALNESGGRAQATPSAMRTSAGVPASYASATQMVSAHAIAVLRGVGEELSQGSRDLRRAYAAKYGLSQTQLMDANDIVLASQRIWDAVVVGHANIGELRERDLELTGFSFEELGRMMDFGIFRQLLLDNRPRFEELRAAAQNRLETQATQLEGEIDVLIAGLSRTEPSPSLPESEQTIPEIAAPADPQGHSLGQQVVGTLTGSRRNPVAGILDFVLPGGWDAWRPRRRVQWLERRKAGLQRQRNAIPLASKHAAEAFLAHELISNQSIQAIGLHESDVRAYINMGRFNRFREDRQSWNRVALQHASFGDEGSRQNLDQIIARAAEAEGGWALSRLEYSTWIRDYINQHPQASDERVVRAAAAVNAAQPDYPGIIWRRFRQIREREANAEGGQSEH